MATSTLITIACALALASCGSTPRNGDRVAPVAAPHSVQEADAALAAAARERSALGAGYAASERACYERFFVNRCLDQAREVRRAGLARVRATEVAMERYKREASVAERDRELARSEADFAAEEKARAAAPPPPPRAEPEAPPPPAGMSLAERRAGHERKLRRDAAQRQAEAGARAAKVARYQRKKAESEARQKRVAERKAEKAARAARENGASGQPAQ